MSGKNEIIIGSGDGEDGGGLVAPTPPTKIKIQVPGGVNDEQAAKIVKHVLQVTGGAVVE